MKKSFLMCALLAVAVMFSACGGDSSSNDDGFTVPDLHPENYPKVDVSSDEYVVSGTMLTKLFEIYMEASDSAYESDVARKNRDEIVKSISEMRVTRLTAGRHFFNLSYSGDGYTVSGTSTIDFSEQNPYPYSYVDDMKVVFNNYTCESSVGSFICNGTMKYQTKGKWLTKYTGADTDYSSADLTVVVNGVTHSIRIEEVQVITATDGVGTYNVKQVLTFDGTQYGHAFEGAHIVDEDN